MPNYIIYVPYKVKCILYYCKMNAHMCSRPGLSNIWLMHKIFDYWKLFVLWLSIWRCMAYISLQMKTEFLCILRNPGKTLIWTIFIATVCLVLFDQCEISQFDFVLNLSLPTIMSQKIYYQNTAILMLKLSYFRSIILYIRGKKYYFYLK